MVVGPAFAMIVFGLAGCWNDTKKEALATYAITSLLLDPKSCVTQPVDPANPDPATDPVDCKTVYVATGGGGVYKSLDGGGSWARINNGLFEPNITELAMDPKDSEKLYAGTENSGLFKTIDGGGLWSNPSASPDTLKSISAIVVDPYPTCLPSPCIYVGSQESGVWVSQNEGQSWTQMNSGLSETTGTIVTALALSSYNKSPSDLYAGTEGGHLFKYNFNPAVKKWEETPPGLSARTEASPLVIAVNPTVPTTIYVGTSGGEGQSQGGTFRTNDGGMNWSVESIPNGQNFSVRVLTFCLQVEPRCPPLAAEGNDQISEPDILYAGVYGLSRLYLPEGLWENVSSISDVIHSGNNVSSLAVDTLRHTTLYAGTLLGFVIKSQDSGAHWKRIDINL